MITRPRGLAAILLVGALALGATAATTGEAAGSSDRIDVLDLPIDVLEDVLPTSAQDIGLDYAPRLVTVTVADRAERTAVTSGAFDATEHAGHDYVEVVLSSQAEQDALDDLGLPYDVRIPDMITRQRERILADAQFSAANAATDLPSGRTSYRVLQDYLDEIDQLVADNPGIAKKVVVGQSFEGRDLVAIEIGTDVGAPEDGRPVMLMFGVHHAREWPSAEAPMEFAHELIDDFNAGDERAVDLLGRTRVVIVPVSNPDGFLASRTTGELIDLNGANSQLGDLVAELDEEEAAALEELGYTGVLFATPGNAYKRKNCNTFTGQPLPEGGCTASPSPNGSGIGTDLNRNYGALWGGPGAAGTEPSGNESINDTSVASPIYRGMEPFSEPETQAIRTLISTRQVTTLISNHTFSNLLLRPVGVQPDTEHPDGFPIGFAPDECFTTPDGRDMGMQQLGEIMTAQTGYSNQFGWELYDTTGTTEDYSYNATGGYGYTFEIGPDEFHPPYEEVVAEYTGTTEAAQAVTPQNAPDLTTATGQTCEGDEHEHTVVGGGLSEAFYAAVANAADETTHSVITGQAPEGAIVEVSRTGTFPLWDGTPVEDTVTTSMTVQDGDANGGMTSFAYHVNPSTRPFADSREYRVDTDEARTTDDTITNNEIAPPQGSVDIPIEIGEGIQWLHADSDLVVPSDDNDITLFAPNGTPIAESAELPGTNESVDFDRAPGELLPGTYVLRVTNYAGTGQHETTITFGDYPGGELPPLQETPRTTEQWTLTCSFDGEELDTQQVTVERGDAADVGELCVAAAGAPAPAPDPGEDLAATGGGAAALAALALGGAVALAGRRRED